MWPNPQEAADLVTFTEEILKENFIFVQCRVSCKVQLSRNYISFFWEKNQTFNYVY